MHPPRRSNRANRAPDLLAAAVATLFDPRCADEGPTLGDSNDDLLHEGHSQPNARGTTDEQHSAATVADRNVGTRWFVRVPKNPTDPRTLDNRIVVQGTMPR